VTWWLWIPVGLAAAWLTLGVVLAIWLVVEDDEWY
jgi:hypothetical protein